jgi:antitoxin component HigA of HigAB toxin-antitoxin module
MIFSEECKKNRRKVLMKLKEIRTEVEFECILCRVYELVDSIPELNAKKETKDHKELNHLSELVIAYENMHYPIGKEDEIKAEELKKQWNVREEKRLARELKKIRAEIEAVK